MTQPAWLIQALDQRVALLRDSIPATDPSTIVMTALREPDVDDDLPPEQLAEALRRWERTCDNCTTYVADDGKFFIGSATLTIHRHIPVTIVYGVCSACAEDFKE